MVKAGNLAGVIAGVTIALQASTATAQNEVEIHTFAGLEMGYGTFYFEKKLDQAAVFPVANLTAGAAYRRFNAALNVSGSVQPADVTEEDFTGGVDRKDFDLIVGYQTNDYFSVFAGYKFGQTDLGRVSRDEEAPVSAHEYFRQSGPFAGINVGRSFENAGKLDFSIAYAALAAHNLFVADGDGAEADEPGRELDDVAGKKTGSITGTSLSLGWTVPMSGNLLFRAKLKRNSYVQDIRDNGDRFRGINENSTMLTVGVIGVF